MINHQLTDLGLISHLRDMSYSEILKQQEIKSQICYLLCNY